MAAAEEEGGMIPHVVIEGVDAGRCRLLGEEKGIDSQVCIGEVDVVRSERSDDSSGRTVDGGAFEELNPNP